MKNTNVFLLVALQSDDAGAALAAAMMGATGAKSETRGNGPLPGGGGLMEEMSALLARRYTHTILSSKTRFVCSPCKFCPNF